MTKQNNACRQAERGICIIQLTGSSRDSYLACSCQAAAGGILCIQATRGILGMKAARGIRDMQLTGSSRYSYSVCSCQAATGILAWQAGSTLHAGSNRDTTRLASREQQGCSLGKQVVLYSHAGSNRDTRLAYRKQQEYSLGNQGAILAWKSGSNSDTRHAESNRKAATRASYLPLIRFVITY